MSEIPQKLSFDELMSPVNLLRERTEQLAGPTGTRVIELMAQAETDELTGLRNRKGLLDELEKRMKSSDEEQFALVFVDLDGFKAVNDTHGHAAGDSVLKNVGKFFKEASQPKKSEDDVSFKFRSEDDEAFRIGGDEFVILIKTKNTENGDRKQNRTEDEFIKGFNGRLSKGIRNSGKNVEQTIDIDGSYGYAVHRTGESVGDFIKRADIRMYRKKLFKKALNEQDNFYKETFDESNTPFSEILNTYKKVTIEGIGYTIKDTNNLALNFFAWAKQQYEFSNYFDYEKQYLTDTFEPPEFMASSFLKFANKYPHMTKVLLLTNPQIEAPIADKDAYRMLFANALFDAVAPDVWDAGESPIKLTV